MVFYVYVHRTNIGEPFYVGKGHGLRAWDLGRRSSKHKRISASHGCVVEIVWETTVEDDALAHEIRLIEFFGTFTTDYSDIVPVCNFTVGGDGSSGTVRSPETRQKMSRAKLGVPSHPQTVSARAKISSARKGRTLSDVAKKKLSLAKTGQFHTVASRAKMSVSKKGKPGHPRSRETREKISLARKGKPSPNKGKPGHRHTDATKMKLSLARKKKKDVVSSSEDS